MSEFPSGVYSHYNEAEHGFSVYIGSTPEAERIADCLAAIADELIKAMKKFPNNSVFRSRHEGYGVLLEEVDELWDAIKNNDHGTGKSQDAAEAVQVGAIALHYLKDFGGGNE